MSEQDVTIKMYLPIKLVMTCSACPEQYDAYIEGTEELVGYLRLRHGYFYASCPDVSGERVYEAITDDSDGAFSEEDRRQHLPRAMLAIYQWYQKNQFKL